MVNDQPHKPLQDHDVGAGTCGDSLDDLSRPSPFQRSEPDSDSVVNDYNKSDIGEFVGRTLMLSFERKKKLLENS